MAHPDGDGWGRHLGAHVDHLRTLVATGSLKASGPLKGTKLRSGFLVFSARSRAEVDALVARDPYAVEGLIAGLDIVEWDPLFGAFAGESSGDLPGFGATGRPIGGKGAMIYELRTYDLKVGRVADYLEIFETHGYPVLSRYAAPLGFWFSGPMGTGPVDQVNHIWAYSGVAEQIERRTALYDDPAWTRDLLTAASDTFVALRGQLMALDPGSERALSAALDEDGGGAPVMASFPPAGSDPAGPGRMGRWRTLTGAVGRTFTLDRPADVDLTGAEGSEGVSREIWHPARFSRLR